MTNLSNKLLLATALTLAPLPVLAQVAPNAAEWNNEVRRREMREALIVDVRIGKAPEVWAVDTSYVVIGQSPLTVTAWINTYAATENEYLTLNNAMLTKRRTRAARIIFYCESGELEHVMVTEWKNERVQTFENNDRRPKPVILGSIGEGQLQTSCGYLKWLKTDGASGK